MSLVQYNNFNQPNLNGLVDINADTIITDTISTTEIIINGENIVDDVLDNKRKLTKIDYDDITDTTEIDSNLTVSDELKIGNITHTPGANYIIENETSTSSLTLRHKDFNLVIRALTIDQFINVNGINDLRINKLFVGGNQINFNAYNDAVIKTTKLSYNSGTNTTTLDSSLNLTGNLLLDAVTISKDELKHLDGVTSNIQAQLNAEADDISSLTTRVTTNENDISVLEQKTTKITYNSGTDTTSVNSKLTVSGETTFNGIVNLNDNLYQYQTTFLYKNLVFTTSNVRLLVLGGTIELTQQELSYLSGLTNNIQFQIDNNINDITALEIQMNNAIDDITALENKTNKITYDSVNDITTINSKVNINGTLTLQNVIHKPGANYEIENTTNSGSIIFKVRDVGGTARSITINQFTNVSGINDVNCNKLVMGGTILRENGSVFNGAATFNQFFVLNGFANFNNDITMTGSLSQILTAGITQSSTGTNTFKGSDFYGRINMTSTDFAQNRITQTILAGDLTTPNANLFKNTQIRQNTNGSTTNMPILDMFETATNKKMQVLMNPNNGSYNPMNEAGGVSNICIGPTQNNAILTYTCWASQRVGFKFKTSSSTNYTSEFWAGNSTNMIMDSINGTSMTNVASIALSGAGNRTIDSNFGSIYTATLLTAVSMSSSTETNLSNGLVLPAGTYNISWNINFIIQTSGTNVDGYYGCYSTSTTAFTNNTILTSNFNGSTISVNNVFSLTGQDYVRFNSSTTIYLRALVGHNKGANHVVFHDPFSHLKAIKIC
jgi:hypothetical protein